MRSRYACDFEATTKIDDCRVWAWGYMNVDNFNDYQIGTDMDSFMVWCLKQDADCYFHNLKYDGSFILNYLLRNGYKLDRKTKPKPNTFNTTISENGQWYQIDITHKYASKGAGKERRVHTTIYDSLKKLPFTIKRIAKAFSLPILKGEIDYKLERPIEWQLTEKEKDYVKNDVEILARALNIQFSQGLDSITVGSDAMKDFKDRIKSKQFAKFFPLLDEEVDSYLRQSYKGGFTWVNPLYQGKIINGGQVYDVNSLYPYTMRYKDMPYGLPLYFKGEYKKDRKYPLYIAQFKCEFELKPGYIPTVQIKNSRFMDNEYLTTSDGEQQLLTMTSVDIKLLHDHYDVYNVEWIDGYKFRQNNNFFVDYIDYWNAIKEKSSGAIRELAKLMLNNLYGKFGKNPDVTPKLPYLKKDKSLGLKIPRNVLGEEEREFTDSVYIAMGSFITAYARDKTIRTAQKCFDNILYCDTDSIHLKGKEIPETIKNEIDSKKLGYWKHECTFDRAKFLRQKTYVEEYNITMKSEKGFFKIIRKHTDIKCAGMPDRIKRTLTFDDFRIGLHSPTGKLMPKQVPGGVVLIDAPFTLK